MLLNTDGWRLVLRNEPKISHQHTGTGQWSHSGGWSVWGYFMLRDKRKCILNCMKHHFRKQFFDTLPTDHFA